MATAVAESTEVAKTSRTERLRAAVKKLQARAGWRELERWILILGAFLVIFGVGAIGLAWYGASHTPFVFEQIPYLISGGLLGLGLAVVGGFLYFGYWLTRLLAQNREQGARTAALLEEIKDTLASADANGDMFVVTSGGTMYHRPDCKLVAGRSDLREITDAEPGLKPCKICNPEG
jgi:hypothetical protein